MILRKKMTTLLIITLLATLLLSVPTYANTEEYEVTEAKILENVELESVSEGLISFYNDDWLYGYMNESAEVIIEAQYDDAGDFKSGIAKVVKDGEVLYIDKTGKVLFKLADIEDQFDDYIDVYDFSDGLALVEVGYYDVAYINAKGEIVIPAGKYDYGTSFSEGIAYVSNEAGDYFAMDTSGNIVFTLNDDWDYYDFHNDRAVVFDYDTDQYSYVDKTGQLIMDFKLDDAFDFVGDYAVYEEVGKYGIIDQSGNFLMNPIYEDLVVFESGCALGYDGTYTTFLNKDFQPTMRIYGDLIDGYDSESTVYDSIILDETALSTTIRDFTGRVIAKYDDVKSLGGDYFQTSSNQLINTSALTDHLTADPDLTLVGDYVYDFMNNKGEVVLSLDEYDSVTPFSDGLATVEKDGKFGYIDTTGKLVVPVKYSSAEPFVNGKAEVYMGYAGYVINKSGVVLESTSSYDYYSDDEEEESDYYTISVDSYGPMGLAEKSNNKIILEPIYEEVDYLGNGIYELTDENYMYGFYDTKTKKLIKPQYEDYDIDAESGLIAVYDEDYHYGIIDVNGKVILDTVYDYINLENNSLISTEKDDIYGLIDLNGNAVLEAKYDMIGYVETVGDLDVYAMTIGDKEYYTTYNVKTKKIGKIIEIDYGGDMFEIMSDGYVAYSTSQGNMIFRDFNGKELLKINDEVVDLNGQYVQCIAADGRYYLMDFDGHAYLKGNDFEDFFLPVESGHVIYTDGTGYGIVSLDGTIKTDRMYSSVDYIAFDVMSYYDNYEHGYVNLDGEEIQKSETYDYLYKFSEGLGLGIREK